MDEWMMFSFLSGFFIIDDASLPLPLFGQKGREE
jgi:hypothetical protein